MSDNYKFTSREGMSDLESARQFLESHFRGTTLYDGHPLTVIYDLIEKALTPPDLETLKSEIYAYADAQYEANKADDKTFLDLAMDYLSKRGLIGREGA